MDLNNTTKVRDNVSKYINSYSKNQKHKYSYQKMTMRTKSSEKPSEKIKPRKIKKFNSNENTAIKKENSSNIKTSSIESNEKFLLTERVKYPKKLEYFSLPKKMLKISSLKNNINNVTISNELSLYEIHKAKKLSLMEQKSYEKRVTIIKNHINVLNQRENELIKKSKMVNLQEKNTNRAKLDKNFIRQALLAVEIDRRNEIQEKKKKILMQKKKNNKRLKLSQEKNSIEKAKNYKQLYIDKKKAEEIRIKNHSREEKIHHLHAEELKTEREKRKERNRKKQIENIKMVNDDYMKSYLRTMKETQKLKNELEKLELIDLECMKKFKITQNSIRLSDDNKIRIPYNKKIKKAI